MRWFKVSGIAVALGMLLAGCVSPGTPIQLRMAEPTVLPSEEGSLNPPVIHFQEHRVFSHRRAADGTTLASDLASSTPTGPVQSAAFAWDNPAKALNNRVDLKEEAVYSVTMVLPENYEYRRLALLRTKSEGLYRSIEEAEQRLQENAQRASTLLSPDARQTLTTQSAQALAQIDAANAHHVAASTGNTATGGADVSKQVALVSENERRLRADDAQRDRLMPPAVVESLSNRIAQWRRELNRIKARVVALELMVSNPNQPFPRVVNGWVETMASTPYTSSGALPFIVEDEYLEWIRGDKVVTIVMFDPNQTPEDPQAVEARGQAPRYWPAAGLTVIEKGAQDVAVPRSALGGTAVSTRVDRREYFNVISRTYASDNGYMRTYLRSANGERMWVFGPDVAPPSNIEVWLQDERGMPVRQLYPAPTDTVGLDETYIGHIAGVEGGGIDPIMEARKRGTIIAVARLGNRRDSADTVKTHRIYEREVERARSRASAAHR